MSKATSKPGLFRQVWNEILAASEAAVAVHYSAPWAEAAPIAHTPRRAITAADVSRARPAMQPCPEFI